MTLFEKISIIGSFSSAVAVAVAVIFFTVQLMNEKKKEKKDKAEYMRSVRSVVSKEAFNIMKQINFYYKLAEKLKSATRTNIRFGYDKLWRQMYIYDSLDNVDFMFFPQSATLLDHALLAEAGKKSEELIPIINNLNAAIWAINQNLDIVIQDASLSNIEPLKEMVRLMVNGNESSNKDLVTLLEPAINEFHKEMEKIEGFKSLKQENNDYYAKRPFKF